MAVFISPFILNLITMEHEKEHITEFSTYGKVWISILLLIVLNLFVAMQHGNWVAPLVIFIAAIQASIALFWFMHLKWEDKFLRSAVIGVFTLFAVVLLITFIDYYYR